MALLQHRRPRRSGTVVVAVAVCLTGVLGVVALTLDGGLVVDKRRQVQAAADAAALAAGAELFATFLTNGGLDDGPLPNKTGPGAGAIAQLAREVAKSNGFEDGVNGVSVQVFIPPQTGLFIGVKGHAEVRISTDQKRFFSTVFGSSNSTAIGARAVSRGVRTTINNGIIVLDPDQDAAFSTGGGALATVKGSAAILVNSNHSGAMNANGGGTVTSQAGYEVTGNYTTPGGGSFTGPITTGVEPTPDPLRFLPAPDPSTLIVRNTKRINHSSASTLNLQPGIYYGGVSVTGKGDVNMAPGIYYFAGGFSFSGQGNLTGSKVLIYNHPTSNSDTISLSGGGTNGGQINLSPMDEGPYKGIVIFQSRSTSDQPDISITGNGGHSLYISGTFYTPEAHLKVTGNGDQDTIGSQYISKTLALGGNGNFYVDWDPNVVPGIRQVWLVE